MKLSYLAFLLPLSTLNSISKHSLSFSLFVRGKTNGVWLHISDIIFDFTFSLHIIYLCLRTSGCALVFRFIRKPTLLLCRKILWLSRYRSGKEKQSEEGVDDKNKSEEFVFDIDRRGRINGQFTLRHLLRGFNSI